MAKKNPRLKKSNVDIEYTREQMLELLKCASDPIYFIKNYIYIKHPKRGKIKFDLYDYQEQMVKMYHNKQYCIVLSARQTGKTETSAAFLLWSAIFKPDQTILIASNKSKNAMEIISKIHYAYEELPDWLKPGINESAWNKHELLFDNNSRIVATTTSVDSGRGMSISLLYCDEYAFVKQFIRRQFYDSILPTISTGGSMIVSSTPNGDTGMFADMWRGAVAGINEFKDGKMFVPWNAPPGRDEAFKKKFMGLLGERKWKQEYECAFISEELTLVNSELVTQAEALLELKIQANELIKFALNDGKFEFFERLQKDAIYLVGVDPSTGSGTDNGVIQVFEFPSMKQVLEYATNTLSPQVMYTELKSILNILEKFTDEVYFSVENNGVGQGILTAYEGDESPPNALLISEEGKVGVNSNVKTKIKACLQFKEAFERNKILINSPKLLAELKSFVRHSGSYAAQGAATDDRIMATLIIFYIIREMSGTNANAYDMIYTVADDIEKRHGYTVEDEMQMVDELEQDRSSYLQKFFDSLHSQPGSNGFIVG